MTHSHSIDRAPPEADTAPPRLDLTAITKQYPGCLANDRIDLSVMPGEIHALLGENGAGKSTLVKIIYGVVHPNAGRIALDGRAVRIDSPATARRLGIGMVFQHFSLFETLTVADNIALGLDAGWRGRELERRIVEVSERYGLHLEPQRHVHELSVGERQRVEIVRCLLQEPRLLIMDEPTSVLTPQECLNLHDTLRRLASEGCSILYISHKLHEIQALCARATVLRAGRVSGRCDPRDETPKSLAEMMIGSELPAFKRRPSTGKSRPALIVDGLSLRSADPHGTDLHDMRIAVQAGEIVGIAGVAGNGQREFLAALSGERTAFPPEAITLDGASIGHLGVLERRRRGLAIVPEERLGRGAVADMSLAENQLLTNHRDGFVRRGLVRWTEVRAATERVRSEYKVVSAGIQAEARSLSGGNLQKFILGREINARPRLLVAAHPTWGVDVAAAAMIHQALLDLSEAGAAVLVLSEDLDELFAISDRIAVISGGRLSPLKATEATSLEEIGSWMTGAFQERTKAGDAAA